MRICARISPHIGIVSDRTARSGDPLIIHNIGAGPEESDMLFSHTITGHFRLPDETRPLTDQAIRAA